MLVCTCAFVAFPLMTFVISYQRGAIPNSINIPFGSAFSPDGQLLPCPAVDMLQSHRNQVKVIVGSRNKHAIHVSRG